MRRLLTLFLGATALAALLSQPAAAQEYSNGSPGPKNRGPAILTPVEAYGVHPPGCTAPGRCGKPRQTYVPYYAPLSPTPTFVRWAPTKYAPLHPYYTYYYMGYSPHRLHCPPPPPYGSDGGWGPGPMPTEPPPEGLGPTPLNYGPYTAVLRDATRYWQMGGNGLVPYGVPPPPRTGPPDLVDMIQVSRSGAGPCQPVAASMMPWNGVAPVAILPPTEDGGEQGGTPATDGSKGPSGARSPVLPE